MDSLSQQKSNRSSVFSLLNPVNEEPSSTSSSQNFVKRNFENTSLRVNTTQTNNNNEHRKRVRVFGVDLDEPYNETPKELLFTVHDQHEYFPNLHHAQQGYLQPFQHHSISKSLLQTPTEDNNNNKVSPLVEPIHQIEQYQPFNSYLNYISNNQCSSSLSGCMTQPPPLSTPSTTTTSFTSPHSNPCSLPSILNPPLTPYTTTYSQSDSHSFHSQHINNNNNTPTYENLDTKKNVATSPTNAPHKYKAVIIQPSSQDPPIEARLIVDDPKTNPFTQQWMEHFQELKAFKEQFGHTNVTRSITGFYNLGNWVAEQRRKFKQGKITESQFNCLNQIGFEWDRSYYFFRTRHKRRGSDNFTKESPRTE